MKAKQVISSFLEKSLGSDFPIYKDDHPVLRNKNDEVLGDIAQDKEHYHLPALKNKMIATMRNANGIGLAAPQIGLNLKILVMDIISEDEKRSRESVMMINPVIRSGKGEISIEEGCLSLPGRNVEVPRLEIVVVEYLDETGKQNVRELSGLAAICVQHEIDHLLGKLMIDYL